MTNSKTNDSFSNNHLKFPAVRKMSRAQMIAWVREHKRRCDTLNHCVDIWCAETGDPRWECNTAEHYDLHDAIPQITTAARRHICKAMGISDNGVGLYLVAELTA